MRQAWGDFRAAEALYSSGNYAWCCFACHQAAEKSLKAILEHFGRPTRGHNLVELLSEVERYVAVPGQVRRACFVLNRYYIPTRYPNAFPSGAPVDMFSEDDAKEALDLARETLRFAERVTGYARSP